MIVVMLGMTGAGKSSQSELLAQREHVEWVYVGQLLRERHDPAIDADLAQGKLVEDDTVNNILTDHFKTLDPHKVVVLDGFPRHLPQAEWLFNLAHELHNGLAAVVHLTIPQDEARTRLLARQRSDDTPRSIDERLNDYKARVLPVVDYFRTEGIPVHEIDGNRPKEIVFAEIDGILHDVYTRKD